MLKFQPGQVVHVVRQGYVMSRIVSDALTPREGITVYRLVGHGDDFHESDLYATFENAVAVLNDQTP